MATVIHQQSPGSQIAQGIGGIGAGMVGQQNQNRQMGQRQQMIDQTGQAQQGQRMQRLMDWALKGLSQTAAGSPGRATFWKMMNTQSPDLIGKIGWSEQKFMASPQIGQETGPMPGTMEHAQGQLPLMKEMGPELYNQGYQQQYNVPPFSAGGQGQSPNFPQAQQGGSPAAPGQLPPGVQGPQMQPQRPSISSSLTRRQQLKQEADEKALRRTEESHEISQEFNQRAKDTIKYNLETKPLRERQKGSRANASTLVSSKVDVYGSFMEHNPQWFQPIETHREGGAISVLARVDNLNKARTGEQKKGWYTNEGLDIYYTRDDTEGKAATARAEALENMEFYKAIGPVLRNEKVKAGEPSLGEKTEVVKLNSTHITNWREIKDNPRALRKAVIEKVNERYGDYGSRQYSSKPDELPKELKGLSDSDQEKVWNWHRKGQTFEEIIAKLRAAEAIK